jgi:rhodanese-related sulfurtransferase
MHDDAFMEQVAEAKKTVPTMTCEAFWAREEQGDRPTVLDVREAWEWEAGHIDEATHIPLSHLKTEVEKLFPEKKQEIIICCATDNRSAVAGKQLIEMGYTRVHYLSGGYSGYCGGRDNPRVDAETESLS